MPSGKIFYEKLTKEQKNKYTANSGIRFSINMSLYCENFRDFILQSFKWNETPEGSSYWQKIANGEK